MPTVPILLLLSRTLYLGNSESAIVDGWELALQHTFGHTGFGTMANVTLVDSNAELDPSDISQVYSH